MNPNQPAYEPLPVRAGTPAARSAKALGAGIAVAVAAACGVAWRVQQRKALPPPPAPASISEPAALEGASVTREVVPLPVAGEGVTQEAAARAAWSSADLSAPKALMAAATGWAGLRPIQRWLWPAKFEALDLQEGQRRQNLASESRRLLGWFPANTEGRRLLFGLRQADGTEKEYFEQDIPRPRPTDRRAIMMQLMMLRAGAASAKEVLGPDGKPMVELTYADGTKKVVPFDPLVFDLRGGGVMTVDRKVLFDLAAKGGADKVQWMNDFGEGTGILVFDSNKSGKPGKTGAEVFGDRTDLDGNGKADGFANGFEALRGMTAKAENEGVLAKGALASGLLDAAALKALEKAYGLKMKVGGFNKEAVSLEQAGVAAIRLSEEKVTRVENFDGRSNDLIVQPGAVFLRADGTTGNYMNVFLAAKVGNLGLRKLVARDRR